MSTSIIIGIIAFLAIAVVLVFLGSCYKRVNKTGEALVITKFGNQEKQAALNGAFVWPLINQFERMDITRKTIAIVREGVKDKVGEEYEGLHCKDNIRANIKVNFYIGINPDPKDILQVANNFTAEGASNIDVLSKHFSPKFSEALKTVIKGFDFEELYTSRLKFRDEVKKLLSEDMESFKLYDVVIDKIEQTPLEAHNPDNVLDSDGIRKISEITAAKNIQTSEIRQKEETEIKKKTVEGEQARLELDKSLTETQQKTNREKEHIRIEQETQIKIKEEEARLEAERVRIKTEQEIQINEETAVREIEVTKINNDKIVEIQREQVNRAKEVEKVNTEREVVEKNIEKEKFVETQKKEIATIVAERTATEKEIATQEELTKDIHVKGESERNKLVAIQLAEAKSQSVAIEKTVTAKADLEATRSLVEKETLIADNKLIVAEKEATGKELIAKAVRVEKAVDGLALADVARANAEVALVQAEATEREGKAEAVKVREVGVAQAEVIQKQGESEAIKLREIGLAKATGEEAMYKAMSAIDQDTRSHEINKINVERERDVQLAEVQASTVIATKNAEVMAAAMSKANIDVIGSGDVFDQIRNGLMSSKSLDKRFESSEVLQKLFGSYTEGKRDFVQDVKEVLQSSDVSTGDIGNLALAQLFAGILKNNPDGLDALKKLINK